MPQVSQSALWTIAVLLLAFTLPVSMAAQAQSDQPPRSLRLSVSTFVGYETDIAQTRIDPEIDPSASYTGVRTTLGYELRTDKVSFFSSKKNRVV